MEDIEGKIERVKTSLDEVIKGLVDLGWQKEDILHNASLYVDNAK